MSSRFSYFHRTLVATSVLWKQENYYSKCTMKSSVINPDRLTEIISFKEIAYKHGLHTKTKNKDYLHIQKHHSHFIICQIMFLTLTLPSLMCCFDKLILTYDSFFFLLMFFFFDNWDCLSDILLTFISCVTISWMLSHYLSSRCYFYIKRIHHMKALYVLTNEKHFPKTLSQLEFVVACLQKYQN